MSYIPLIARVDSLPPLPESVIELEQLFNNGDPDIDDIVKIIEADPALTTDILSKVNAPLYGFSRTIVDVRQAITLFGAPQIRSIVLAASLERCFEIDLSPYDISTSEYSKISSMQSEMIFQWYMSIDIDLARQLTPIAFLMEIGKILIAKDIIETDKKDEFLEDIKQYHDVSYVENIHTMMTTAQINALIFKHLNLNENFYETMKYLDAENECPDNLKDMVLALQIVRTAINVQEQLTENSIEKAKELVNDAGFNIQIFERVSKRITRKYLED